MYNIIISSSYIIFSIKKYPPGRIVISIIVIKRFFKLKINLYFRLNWAGAKNATIAGFFVIHKRNNQPITGFCWDKPTNEGLPFTKWSRLMRSKLYFQIASHRSFYKNGKHFFVFQATVNLGQTRRKRFQVKNIFH